MGIAENIIKIRERYGLTQAELGSIAGVTDRAVSSWEKGIAEPRMGAIQRIADHFGITKSSIIEDEELTNTTVAVSIPVLGSVPAGIPIEAIEDVVDWEEIPTKWTTGGREYFGLQVQGNSMYPKYIEGDTIIVRKDSDCESGQDCVVYVNGYDATLKKVIKKADHIILQPLNPEYEPIMYEYNDEEHPVNIAGVVVEIRRKV